jgi:hypothetical protein
MATEALLNTETVPHFIFYGRGKQSKRGRKKRYPAETRVIDGELAWTLVSADGVNVVHYLPGLIKNQTKASSLHCTAPRTC